MSPSPPSTLPAGPEPQYVYLPPESSPGPNSFSTKTVPGAPKKFRHGLQPLWDRLPGPLPSSELPPVFKPVEDKYFMDKYGIPTPRPVPTAPAQQDANQTGNNFANITPPPSHSKIEEAPGRLLLDMPRLYAMTDTKVPKNGADRTTMMRGGNLLQKRKTRPRVYEYEPGDAKRFLHGIEDADQRRATMRALIHATYPPDDDFVPAMDGTYHETLGPNQETGLRQPMVGDAGIPDTRTLLLLLAYRAEYNIYDKNIAVRPAASVKAPSSSGGRKRSYDESAGYDADVTDIQDADARACSEAVSDTKHEPSLPPSPLGQTTVKRIRIVKNPRDIPVESIEPAEPTPSTIAPLKTPIHGGNKRDFSEYADDEEIAENDNGTTAHDEEDDGTKARDDDDAADASSSDEIEENEPTPTPSPSPTPLVQTRVKRIRLTKKDRADPAPAAIVSEAPKPTAASSHTTSTGHDAAVFATPSTITDATATTVESATSAKFNAPENVTGDTIPALKHDDATRKVVSAPATPTGSMAPALKHKVARKAASAPATPTGNLGPAHKLEVTRKKVASAPATPTGFMTPTGKHRDARKVASAPATPTGYMSPAPTKHEDAHMVATAPATPTGIATPASKRKYTPSKVALPAPVISSGLEVKQPQQQKKRGGHKSAPVTPTAPIASPTNPRQAYTDGDRKTKATSKKDGVTITPRPGSRSSGKSVEDDEKKITKRVTRSMAEDEGSKKRVTRSMKAEK